MRFPASLVFRCPMEIYFMKKYPEYSRFPKELSERGRYAEKEFEKFLNSRRIGFERQKYLNFKTNEFTIYGKADFVSSSVVFEVKSVRRFKKPVKNWIGQITLYMGMLRKKDGYIAEYNGGAFKLYPVKFRKSVFEKAIDFFRQIYLGNLWKDNDYCDFCSYSFLCKSFK